jgi:hypothetical protein
MQFNGYILKDKEEQLNSKANRLQAKIVKENKYFESQGVPSLEQIHRDIQEYQSIMTALNKLSYLQCWYNTQVVDTVSNRTLHELIKGQNSDRQMQALYSRLVQSKGYDPGYLSTEDKYEYPKVLIDESYCETNQDQLTESIRGRRARIRVLNGTFMETPKDTTDWDSIFAL